MSTPSASGAALGPGVHGGWDGVLAPAELTVGRAERLLRAVAVSLVPELPGPYSAAKNGGSCGKRHSLRVRFRDRCVRQERWRDQYVQRQGGQSESVISHPKPVLLNSLFLFVALLPTLLSKLGICNLCFPSPLLHSLA